MNMNASNVVVIQQNDPWPEAISDGLTLPCAGCGQVPWLDYRVTDEAWLRNVPSAERRGVVCLKCYLDRGGSLADVEDIQIIGDGETLIAEPRVRYIFNVIDADFNNIARGGLLKIAAVQGNKELAVGQRVVVADSTDDESSTYAGVVAQIDGRKAYIDVEWSD